MGMQPNAMLNQALSATAAAAADAAAADDDVAGNAATRYAAAVAVAGWTRRQLHQRMALEEAGELAWALEDSKEQASGRGLVALSRSEPVPSACCGHSLPRCTDCTAAVACISILITFSFCLFFGRSASAATRPRQARRRCSSGEMFSYPKQSSLKSFFSYLSICSLGFLCLSCWTQHKR